MTQVKLTQQLSLWGLQRELNGVLDQLYYLLIQVSYLPSFTLMVFYSQLRSCWFYSLVHHSISRSSYSQGNSWQYLSLKGPHSKDFTVYYMGSIGYPFYFLHFTFLSLAPLFLVLSLSPSKLFPMFFFPSVVFPSNVSSFFLIVSNIPDQIFYYSIHITSLPYIFLVVLLYETLYNLLFLLILCYETASKKETLSHTSINSKDFIGFHKGLKL